jgi:hypothetical protein
LWSRLIQVEAEGDETGVEHRKIGKDEEAALRRRIAS